MNTIKTETTLILGHKGLVGSSLLNEYNDKSRMLMLWKLPLTYPHNLKREEKFRDFLEVERPSTIILAAAKVGGIGGNSNNPVDFIFENLAIQQSVLTAAKDLRIPKVIFLGSSCIYPRNAHQPIAESELLSGKLEESNRPYAIAKIAGIEMVRAVRKELGLNWVSIMPTNLFGPGDRYDSENGHVIPAMIQKFFRQIETGEPAVLWGDGSARREFLYAGTFAKIIRDLEDFNTYPDLINVGTGYDMTIAELAVEVQNAIKEATGFKIDYVWDHSKPNGTPKKTLDLTTLKQYFPDYDGLEERMKFREQLLWTVKKFLENKS